MTRFWWLIAVFLLAGCTHISPSVTDVQPVAVEAPAEKLTGTHAVAVLGDYQAPIVMLGTSQIEFKNGEKRPGGMTIDMTIVFGEPLRTSLVDGLKKLVAVPQFVESEVRAREVARGVDGAVIVRLLNATATARQVQPTPFSRPVTDVSVRLSLEVFVVTRDGRDSRVAVEASGTATDRAYASLLEARYERPGKEATEEAIGAAIADVLKNIVAMQRKLTG